MTRLSFTAARDTLRVAGLPDYLAEEVALDLCHDGFVDEDVMWFRFDQIAWDMAHLA